MGIESRIQQLLQGAADETEAHSIVDGYKRLMEPSEMGSVYKAFAIAKVSDEEANPLAGFGHLGVQRAKDNLRRGPQAAPVKR